MKKHSLFTALLIMLMYMAGTSSFAHDIEVENADGITIYYNSSKVIITKNRIL